MDVVLPNGQTIAGVPDGTTKAQLAQKLQANGFEVPLEWLGGADKSVPDQAPARAEAPADERGFAQKADAALKGGLEAAASMLTGATTGLLGRAGGTLGGLAGAVKTGKFGTQEGAEMAAQTAEEGAQKLTYTPKTEEGRATLQAIGRAVDATKIAGLGPSEAVAAGTVMEGAQAARQAVRPMVGHAARVVGQDAKAAARKGFAKDIPDEPLPSDMVGVGSAATDEATMRRQRADSLPVPIKLTKGQAERTFEQQQFERETAKDGKLGAPLRERYSEQNAKILQNFDAWVDQTGAEAGSLRATGRVVDQVLVNKSNKAKTEIRSAYKTARTAGEMQERVDASPLQSYLDNNQAEAINATVLQSVEAKLSRIATEDGKISLNDLEEIRKMTGRLANKDATNAEFGREVKKLIDTMTEGKGGELYKKARGLRFRYAQEFENHAVINKLLSKKPGTQDRAVAYEDVFDHSILKGSLDDVRQVRKVLQTAGDEGQQAWKELQGGTLKHIKDEISKSTQIDQAGNPVVSPAKLHALVNELDKDGKLDFIFGKQGAQQIRDVDGIALDVLTSPPNAVNHSNTASILMSMLDKVAAKTTGVSFVGAATGLAAKEWKASGTRSRVRDALK